MLASVLHFRIRHVQCQEPRVTLWLHLPFCIFLSLLITSRCLDIRSVSNLVSNSFVLMCRYSLTIGFDLTIRCKLHIQPVRVQSQKGGLRSSRLYFRLSVQECIHISEHLGNSRKLNINLMFNYTNMHAIG